MKLVDQLTALEAGLPDGWERVRLSLTAEQASDLPRVAQVLGAINGGRVGDTVVLDVTAGAGPNGVHRVSRLFQKLDEERTWCTVTLAEVAETAPVPSEPAGAEPAAAAGRWGSVAEAWDAALAELPPDWSDLLCELEIESSALLDRTALLCAPINPTRDRARLAFTFRCSSRQGYGVSRSMARRCLERLDAEAIAGRVEVLRVLSDTDMVYTQGPVWLVGGKTL
jgi:hypothetical protein